MSALPPEGQALVERARRFPVSVPAGARARVWSALERRRRPRAERLIVAAFFAGAAAAALVAVVLPRRAPEALAFAHLADGSERAVRAGETFASQAGLTRVELGAQGRMVLGAQSRVTFERRGGAGLELRVDRGTALVHVTPRPADAPFWVYTPRFSARVVGTVFRVVVGAEGDASIAVAHGAVEVHPVGAPAVTVRTGGRWPAGAVALPAMEELDLLGAADLEGATRAAFGVAAPAPVLACVGPARDRLACLLEVGRVADGARAETALYDAGFVTLRELGDPRRALAIWEEGLSRFPNGPLRRDLQASIVDALVASHQSTRALAAIDALLFDGGEGLRAPEMRFVRATLWRAADGNCRRAEPELERALERASEPWAARARSELAACRRDRGR
jgi:hypothetical protein